MARDANPGPTSIDGLVERLVRLDTPEKIRNGQRRITATHHAQQRAERYFQSGAPNSEQNRNARAAAYAQAQRDLAAIHSAVFRVTDAATPVLVQLVDAAAAAARALADG